MSACCRAAISAVAEAMNLMSGSFVLFSGVGTQTMMASAAPSTSGSALARRRPASTRGLSAELGMSPMYDSPIPRRRTFSRSLSYPVTRKPARASSTTRGSPT
jgi:hypothetical protein